MHTTISARFDLLDVQIVDASGIPVGRVDDVVLQESGGDLRVTALLTGQRALGQRLGGAVGGLLSAVAARLAEGEGSAEPTAVPVSDIDSWSPVISLRAELADLPQIAPLERWLSRWFVRRLPGSRS
jgi:sporulation protein YlmC with PRC-barrel domain